MRLKLRRKSWLAMMAGAAALGFIALPAEAAPVGDANALRAAAGQNTDVQAVHWRDRHYRYRSYHYYGPRYGHRHHRPGFGFYYGPRHHHHRHWRYRGW